MDTGLSTIYSCHVRNGILKGGGALRKRAPRQVNRGGKQCLSAFKASDRLRKAEALRALFKNEEMQKPGFGNVLFTYFNVIRQHF